MKKYKTQTVQKDVVISTICNKCGKEFPQYEGCCNDEIEYFKVRFGWGSFLDMSVYIFDLCDNCFNEFKNTFKIEPEEYLEF